MPQFPPIPETQQEKLLNPENKPHTDIYARLKNVPWPDGDTEDPFPSHLRDHIDWESTARVNTATFSVNGKTYYLRHSTPVSYSQQGLSPRIVDLVVVGESLDEVTQTWDEEIASSEERKANIREMVSANILPELEAIKSVATVLGRGSVFDPRRVIERRPDVDIIVFLNTPLETDADITAISTRLRAIHDKYPHILVGITPYIVRRDTHSTFTDEAFTLTDNIRMVVMFDLMSFTGESSFPRAILSRPRTLKPYARESLEHGDVLLDRSDGRFAEMRAAALRSVDESPSAKPTQQ